MNKSIIETILGWSAIIGIIIIIKKIIEKKQLEEQIRNQKLQQYYKEKNMEIEHSQNNKIDPNLLNKIEDLCQKEKHSNYQINNNIFTDTEKFFYKVLKEITIKMDLTIFTKVRLADIIYSPKFNYKDFNRIKAKHIDFVLTDKDGNIKALIELDDKSHEQEKRKERDEFLNNIFQNQKIKLLRIPVKYSYNTLELKQKIEESL